MRVAIFYSLITLSVSAIPPSAFSDDVDIDAAVQAYEATKKAAADQYLLTLHTLVAERLEENDTTEATRIRRFIELFKSDGVLFADGSTKRDVEAYSKTIADAADLLRMQYTEAIKAANKDLKFDRSERLAQELQDHRLPISFASFKTYGSPRYINHQDFRVGSALPNTIARKVNSTWEELSGFAAPGHVSFRATSWPSRYLEHFAFKVRITPYQDDPKWQTRATFVKVEGLANAQEGFSLKGLGMANRYLRIRDNGEAWMDVFQNNQKFKTQATFFSVAPLFRPE